MKPKDCIYMNDSGCVLKIDIEENCPCERGRRETRHQFQRRLFLAYNSGDIGWQQFVEAVQNLEKEFVDGE